MRARALVLALLGGCASTPTPDFEAERLAIYGRTEVACLIVMSPDAAGKFPEGYAIASRLLTERKATCTAEMVHTGAQMVLNQGEREKRVAAMQAQERSESASRAGDRIMRGLMGFATGYAIGSALTPPASPPPRPVNCVTTYSYGRAYTTCN